MLSATRVKDINIKDLSSTARDLGSSARDLGSSARDVGASTRSAAAPYVEVAGSKLSDGLEVAGTKLGESLEVARQRLRSDVAPAVITKVDQALDASAPARAEAANRAGAAFAALKGEQVVAKSARRWPLLLLGLGLGTALGVAISRLLAPPPAPVVPSTSYPTGVNGSQQH